MKSRSWSNEQLIAAVASSISISETLKKLGLSPKGGNYNTVHKYVKQLSLDTSHWLGEGYLRGKTHNWNGAPLNSILVKDSSYTNTHALKLRLIKNKLLNYVCSICGLTEWNNSPITLQLDHINGHRTDNRIENLRILCPNCHSQTETFSGRNLKSTRDRT